MSDRPDVTEPAVNAGDGAASEETTRPEDTTNDAGPQPTRAEYDKLKQERDDYYERLLRKTAEFDNYRKRVERERRELVQGAAGDVLSELLPILDNFERALQADAGTDVEAYRKGVELIRKQLLDLLARRGATPIDAVGKDFDPNFHQAITHEESPGKRDGEVIEELQKGYMLGERLLRPAMVKVAKA